MTATVQYTSPDGDRFQLTLKAAQLVPSLGNAGLPPPYGILPTHRIEDPQRFGLLPVEKHRLRRRYPNVWFQYHALIVPEEWMVKGGKRGDQLGLALYADYNGSTLAASITSENGRNGMAPFDWEGEPNSPTDPVAQMTLEWRDVKLDGTVYNWQNHLLHGTTPSLDWRDGVPTDLRTMYDPYKGTVRQSILVPKFNVGMGLAEQTLNAEDVTDFYSVVVWFRRHSPAIQQFVSRYIDRGSSWDRTRSYGGGYESFGPATLGGGPQLESLGGGYKGVVGAGGPVRYRGGGTSTRGMSEALRGGPSEELEAELKMSSGGSIRQAFPYDGFGPGFWQAEPTVALVFVPITATQAKNLDLGVTIPRHRRDFFNP